MTKSSRPRLALVLGSGGARGWAHIGVIRALEEAGLKPDLIVGTSIGALVGAAYAAGRLDGLERWITPLDHLAVLKLLDTGFANGGFIHGTKLMSAFTTHVGEHDIEELECRFVAIATDIESGREVWLQSGPAAAAVRASIAIPGLFAPVFLDDRWLVDGGLVNPVPVSVARALGADAIVAVNLNGELLGAPGVRHHYARPGSDDADSGMWQRVRDWWATHRKRGDFRALFSGFGGGEAQQPGILSVVADSIDVMQDRITRARLAGEPPDVMLSPAVGDIGMLEFDRAEQAITAGRECAQAQLDSIRSVSGHGDRRPTSPAPAPARN